MIIRTTVVLLFLMQFCQGQDIAVLKYEGGGDWYGNPTALPNLASFCNENISAMINKRSSYCFGRNCFWTNFFGVRKWMS